MKEVHCECISSSVEIYMCFLQRKLLQVWYKSLTAITAHTTVVMTFWLEEELPKH